MQATGNFFIRAVNWLQAHRLINIISVFAYYIFIFYMHVPCAKLSDFVEHHLSLPVYNKVVIAISIFLLGLFLAFIITSLIKYTDNRLHKIAYLVAALSFVILHFNIMFEMNIEIIHIFQYSILAFLLFPLTRRFGAAVCFAIPFMLVDEWNQYINLYPGYVQYFEFNDVILDINGCALAVITLYIAGVKGQDNIQPLWKRPEFLLLVTGLLVIMALIYTCVISLYANGKCDNTWLVLNIVPEAPAFWRKFPNRDVWYHIMQPVEAIISIAALAILYFGLDEFRKKQPLL